MPINYIWFHPSGRQLMNDQLNIFVNQGQLSLINVQRKDLGVYRCIGSNVIGNTEVNFTLNVLCMLNFDILSKRKTFFEYYRRASYYSNSRIFYIRSINVG
jgi:hypothetical protein